jgi:zinc transport system permease protein
LVLPAAASRNIAKNLRQYHLYSVLAALFSGIIGLFVSYTLGTSTGAAISLILALLFVITFIFRKVRS